jgi:hypothetical protein
MAGVAPSLHRSAMRSLKVMLTRDQVLEEAKRCEVVDAERLLDFARPAWRLDPTDEDPVSTAATKIGGGADLAPGESWPINRYGVPYALLAQINCAALPDRGDEWPDPVGWKHDGKLLRIFADCAHVDGVDAVVLASEPTAELVRREPPPMPDPFPVPHGCQYVLPPQDFGHGENGHVAGSAFCLTPFVSLPEADVSDKGSARVSVAYSRWRLNVASAGRTYQDLSRPSHLLGTPSVVQHDPLEDAARLADDESPLGLREREPAQLSLRDPANWQVLLHLASDDQLGFDYGGVGAYTVVAPLADLRLGLYHRAYALWQF